MLFFQLFNEYVIPVMSPDAIRHDTAILNIFVVSIIGPGHFELVTIEELGRGIDLGKC